MTNPALIPSYATVKCDCGAEAKSTLLSENLWTDFICPACGNTKVAGTRPRNLVMVAEKGVFRRPK
jgi:predicted RNA-binding Zn-ribbon protein involved in translation (DUF1610 family)